MNNLWPPQWDTLWADVRAGEPWVLATGGALGLLLAIALVVLVVRALKGKDLNAKASIGFGVVQTGVAYITITGVYEFFHRLVGMPWAEAALLAAFIEACVWAAVGMIYAYGKDPNEDDGRFGPAGPFFWITVVGGGVLAILGSLNVAVAAGRIVIVVLGAYMWYLRLLQVTRRSGTPSRWRWTPKAFLLAVGAIVPGDEDVKNEAREWQVRKLARAIRWANSRQPWRWLGERTIVRGAEQAPEDVMAEARCRYARAYVTRLHARTGTRIMTALIESAERQALGNVEPAAPAVAGKPEPTRATESAPAESPTLAGQNNGHPARLPAAETLTRLGSLPGQNGRAVPIALPTPARTGNGHLPAKPPAFDAFSQQPGQGEADPEQSETLPVGKSMTDDEILETYGPELIDVARRRSNGQIGRSVVQTRCGVGASRAERIMARINDLAALPDGSAEAELAGASRD